MAFCPVKHEKAADLERDFRIFAETVVSKMYGFTRVCRKK